MTWLKSITLASLCATSALAQTPNIIELPDSLWAGDSVKWERKVPYYCEGPAYEEGFFAGGGNVYFTQQIGNSTPNWPVWRIKPGSDTGAVWYNTYQNNGLQFDKFGQLIAAQNGRLSRLTGMTPVPTAKGSGMGGAPDTATIVASGNNGVTFNQANDLTIGKNGDIFFTALGSAVYYLSPSRVLYTATNTEATINQANGIERLASDSNSLYVNSSGGTGGNTVYKFTIGTNGSLSNKTAFISSITSPDGGTYDSHGNRYVASYSLGEIRVYNAAGTFLGRIAMRMQSGIYDSVASAGRVGNSGNASNCVFGGGDLKTLYITGDGGLYSIRLKIAGVPSLMSSAIRPGLPQSRREMNGETESRDLRGRWVTPESKVPAVRVPVSR
jgi:sugar lactone lactonase YvrE